MSEPLTLAEILLAQTIARLRQAKLIAVHDDAASQRQWRLHIAEGLTDLAIYFLMSERVQLEAISQKLDQVYRWLNPNSPHYAAGMKGR
jgi:hypothetical protein